MSIGWSVTKRQLHQLYPGGKNVGIDYGDVASGVIHRVLVKMGQNPKYPNEVRDGKLYYCYSPVDQANQAMRRAFELGKTFLVCVGHVDSNETRVFVGRIATLCDVIEAVKRYVIEVIQEPSALATPPSLTPGELVLPAPPKRSRDESTGRRPVLTRQPLPAQYDSYLELRHERCMRSLGMRVSRYVPTVGNLDVRQDEPVAYTPDFDVLSPRGVRYVVEIKPRYPYEIEQLRCIAYCQSVPGVPVVLMYNSVFGSPFVEGGVGGGQGQYFHADCVRGMLFLCDYRGEVRVEFDVAYFCDETAAGIIAESGFQPRSLLQPGRDRLFYNASLHRAYEAADRDA